MQLITGGLTRPNWRDEILEQGLPYNDTTLPDGQVVSYWSEGNYVTFTSRDCNLIGQANEALWQAYIEAGEKILAFEEVWHDESPEHARDCHLRKLGIPSYMLPGIIRSWQLDGPNGSTRPETLREHWPSIYGRFDYSLQLDAHGNVVGVKLLEFNADTPTSVVETILQWDWYEKLHQTAGTDQWNSLHEGLFEQWVFELTAFRNKTGYLPRTVHLAYTNAEESGEDFMTIVAMKTALMEAARRMGTAVEPAFRTKIILVEDIQRVPTGEIVVGGLFNGTHVGHFADKDGLKIEMIFKLYPWEWLVHDSREGFNLTAAHDLATSSRPTIWIEPPYKLLWSNKGFLAILWELFKDDARFSSYLLGTYFANDPNIPEHIKRNHARKPILGREGANTTIVVDGRVIGAGPSQGYGQEGFVLQELALLPQFQGPDGPVHLVVGGWMTGDAGVALCLRGSSGPVTDNLSQFYPHFIEE